MNRHIKQEKVGFIKPNKENKQLSLANNTRQILDR